MTERMSDRKYDVITFGDLNVDLIVTGDVVPQFGQVEKLVDDYVLEMGGSCSIFACQAAKLGLKVGILGRVGDDGFGQLIIERLNECGVDTSHIVVDPTLKTGLSIPLCTDDDRAILTYMGTINALGPDDVTDEYLASSRHLHYGSYFLHTGLIAHAPDIVRRAHALDLSISLDTNWDPGDKWNGTLAEVLPQTDIFMPNEQELHYITALDDQDEAAAYLQELGIPLLTFKLGSDGARAYQMGETGQTAIFDCSVPPATGGDSVGAGDSFDAGFLAGWLCGLPTQRCLEIACECGRSVASAVGGLAGQPTWDDIVNVVDVT